MKSGRTLVSLAQELERQLASKKDLVVSSSLLHHDTDDAGETAIGIEEGNAVTTRGWYRVEPGRCLRPDIAGTPKQVFSYAEAIDSSGQTLASGGKPLAWGGTTTLCTRAARFELYDHVDCTARGLTQAGFAAIELKASATVRFK